MINISGCDTAKKHCFFLFIETWVSGFTVQYVMVKSFKTINSDV